MISQNRYRWFKKETNDNNRPCTARNASLRNSFVVGFFVPKKTPLSSRGIYQKSEEKKEQLKNRSMSFSTNKFENRFRSIVPKFSSQKTKEARMSLKYSDFRGLCLTLSPSNYKMDSYITAPPSPSRFSPLNLSKRNAFFSTQKNKLKTHQKQQKVGQLKIRGMTIKQKKDTKKKEASKEPKIQCKQQKRKNKAKKKRLHRFEKGSIEEHGRALENLSLICPWEYSEVG